MSIAQFNFPTIIRFGVGAIAELAPHLSENGLKRPLVVTDPLVAGLPFFQEILDGLKKAGLSVTVTDATDSVGRDCGGPAEAFTVASGLAVATEGWVAET